MTDRRYQLVRSYTIAREIDKEVHQVMDGYSDKERKVEEYLNSVPVGELRKYHKLKLGYSGTGRKAHLIKSLMETIFRVNKYQGAEG